jgi:hypothetical protein
MRVPAVAACLTLALAAVGACKSAESKGAPPPETTPGSGHVIAVPGAKGGSAAEIAPVATGSAAGSAAGSAQPAAVDDYDSKPDTSFNLAVNSPEGAAVGAETVAHVVVTPGSGYHVNKDYPIKLVLEAPPGVKVAKAELVTADAARLSDSELRFDVKLSADKAGTYTVDGRFKFAVCTESTCDPKRKKIQFQLAVK